MSERASLLAEIAAVRNQVLDIVAPLGPSLGCRSHPDGGWSVAEVVEHLALAEEFGIRGLWDAVGAAERDAGVERLGPELADRSVDEIFSAVPSHVDAPEAVVPRNGGRPFGYWLARLRSNQAVIAELAEEMERVGMERVVLPHYLVGPLDGRQRLQFFRWHLQRHMRQIERTLAAISER